MLAPTAGTFLSRSTHENPTFRSPNSLTCQYHLQAKRWENPISRPEIQKFAGALQGKRARKGVFLTTSSFTTGAQEYAKALESKIVLIDGDRLTHLLVDHNVGVESIGSYVVKSIDADYFTDD